MVRLVPSKVGRTRRYSGGTRGALADANGFLESLLPFLTSSSALDLWLAVGIMTRLLGEAVVRWVSLTAGAANSLLLLAGLPLLGSFLVRLLDLAAASSSLASAVAPLSAGGSALAALRFLPATAAAAAVASLARPLDLDRVVLLPPAPAVVLAAAADDDADERPLLAPPAAALPDCSEASTLAAFRARLPKAPLPRRDFPLPAAAAALSSCAAAAAGSAASPPLPMDDLVFRRVSMAWGCSVGTDYVRGRTVPMLFKTVRK